MEASFKIRRLAVEVNNEDCQFSTEKNMFVYRKNKYTKLFDFNFETLLYDISLNSDLKIEVEDKTEIKNIYISLHLFNENKGRRNIPSRIRILKHCCSDFSSFLFTLNEEEDNELYKDSIADYLFDLLQEKHGYDISVDFNENQLNACLRPSLRPYQIRAVKWMLDIETQNKQIDDYKIIKFVDCDKIFFIHQYTLDIYVEVPNNLLPKGGILADEMGLGKTVEMLALILLRQNPNISRSNILSVIENDRPSLVKIKKFNSKIFCVCCNNYKHKTKLIECIECKVFQHVKCVRKYSEPTDPHLCPNCWSKKNQLILSRATVIVTPTSIKKQWFDEIKKHVISPLKVLMYPGVSTNWISPSEVANYDIILTDYNILKREIYFSSDNKSNCNFRNSKKYMRIESPLLKVMWQRVCLDEAQMVESTNSKASQMVKRLPAVHRWAVSGTPISKSLEDIRGLLEFLDAYPFYEKNYWKILLSKFYKNEEEPLLNILTKLMWRSCKKNIINELNIPEQKEIIHYINLDDAEKLFYCNERHVCNQSFKEKVSKLIVDSAHSTVISKFHSHTLRKILEPLKKIRQDCTVPMLLKFQNNQNHIKKLLQPQELLEHLKTSNELECKNQIRIMASNYNGLGAIFMIREDYHNAVKMYKSVISLAKEFSGPLSVDSLLQIHALHNLDLALISCKNSDFEERADIVEQKLELEWKYISTYFKKYLEALEIWNKTAGTLDQKLKGKEFKKIENAFFSIFEELNRHNLSDSFLMKIQEENVSIFNSIFSEYNKSIKTVEMYIFNWLRNILSNRNQLQIEFKQFIKIVNLIKPKENLNPIVSIFVKTVFDCHIKNIRLENNESDQEDEKDNENKVICELCKTKILLSKYECLIFDKRIHERTQISDGTWNPCIQEIILKLALSISKNKNFSSFAVLDFEKSLELIDFLKKEYKELIKLWIEVEYIAKAYDELEMCKMRLTAIEESNECDQSKNVKNVIYQIPTYQIDDTFLNLSNDLNQSKIEFYKKLGRLKYIKHLEENIEPDNCPICKTLPKSKYCVLDCGHVLCVLCLNEMTRYKASLCFNCAICRTRVNNVFYVTRKVAENNLLIKGEYSSKVQKILSVIIKLKIENSKIKILIFSHWKSILKIISTALNENSVEHRLMWSTKSIEEFKDKNLNITCMLMLLTHGSKGLNLIESTHVFLVEPILNIAEELQAINRVHRIGQTKITTVHRFIVRNTIEEKIFNTMSKLKSLDYNSLTIDHLSQFLCEEIDPD